jgi:hypothetical protein
VIGGVIGWFLQRWIGYRDKAVDRGRDKLESARPEVVPVGVPMNVGTRRATAHVRNRGLGTARDVRVTFTGSAATGRVNEIESGREAQTGEMELSDAPFFRQAPTEPAQLTVSFENRFGDKYSVVLPVRQESRADGGFNMLPEWGQHRLIEPKLSKKRLREIGGP